MATDNHASSRRAVVLLSGGLDSATTLAIARDDGYACCALSFNYGQRHAVELDAAKQVARSLGAVEHTVIGIDLRAFGGSALTDDIGVPKDRDTANVEDDIPVTYVPARNTIFLSYALACAEVRGARDIFIGVNAIDYSGYPDCRPAFIDTFERMANLATKMTVEGNAVRIHAPLLHMTKAEIIGRGIGLGVDYGLTISCYDPDERGGPCRRCDACRLRAAGFADAGLDDPRLV